MSKTNSHQNRFTTVWTDKYALPCSRVAFFFYCCWQECGFCSFKIKPLCFSIRFSFLMWFGICHCSLIPPTCISSWSYLFLHLHMQNSKGPNKRLSIIRKLLFVYLWSKQYCSPKRQEKTQFIAKIYLCGSFFSTVKRNIFLYMDHWSLLSW